MELLPYILSLFVLPGVGLVVSGVFRHTKGICQTASTDFILVFIVMDMNFVLFENEIKAFVNSDLTKNFLALIVGLILAGVLTACFSIGFVEKRLEEYNYCNRLKLEGVNYIGKLKEEEFPFFRWLSCWILAFLILTFHVLLFTLKIGN